MVDDIFPLPCPFCGHEPAVHKYTHYYPGKTVWRVVCDCEFQPMTDSYALRNEAIAAWNGQRRRQGTTGSE